MTAGERRFETPEEAKANAMVWEAVQFADRNPGREQFRLIFSIDVDDMIRRITAALMSAAKPGSSASPRPDGPEETEART
jgi:hypothetical protein